jgi:hypothetical protein
LLSNTIKISYQKKEEKKKKKGKLPFAPINYNAMALSPYEFPTVLLCPYELPFCAQKPLPSVKAVNSNSQSDNAL